MSWFGSSSEKKLKPSEILFSQDSINNHFGDGRSYSCQLIGKTLDDLCEGRCSISDIPRISVTKKGSSWVTADNRRLWVFQHLERLGRCDCITVNIIDSMQPWKQNSTTDGKTVKVRGDPGGEWHEKDGPTSIFGSKSIIVAGAALLWWMASR